MLLSSFYAPWTQNERFSDIFMGYRKKPVSWNGLFSVKTDQFQRYDFCYSSLPYNHNVKIAHDQYQFSVALLLESV